MDTNTVLSYTKVIELLANIKKSPRMALRNIAIILKQKKKKWKLYEAGLKYYRSRYKTLINKTNMKKYLVCAQKSINMPLLIWKNMTKNYKKKKN